MGVWLMDHVRLLRNEGLFGNLSILVRPYEAQYFFKINISPTYVSLCDVYTVPTKGKGISIVLNENQ